MCGGINSVWVKDGSGCATEYFQDPDDSVILGTYPNNCFADLCVIFPDLNWSSVNIVPTPALKNVTVPPRFNDFNCFPLLHCL